ncbi:hypothetical protein OKA04_11780 [Luteolibacter flavescens]|uniref:Quinol:cytochrome C oxidoreductase n=1 Tax=Luteolibacter flavescens TaxID=1859460 RepID=A0ABT3FPA8_9BACT|nr:hypothetical protein [Luteolibacter flavescens]MCW1885410.1 hypothetical protein [Luteolibacter flavescens]
MAHHHVTSADIPVDGERLVSSKVEAVKRIAGYTSLLLSLISAYLLFGAKPNIAAPFAYSWLFALFFFFTLAAGGCFWTLLHNVSNSGWGTSVRRIMENLGYVFPFMFIFAWPLLVPSVQQWLFEWMNTHRAAGGAIFEGNIGSLFGFYGTDSMEQALTAKHEALLVNKQWYMNQFAWYARFFFYFIGLGLVIHTLRKFSVNQDTDPNPTTKNLFKARFHSTYTLIIFAITITFAAIDWLSGLRYDWFSTMWGVYIFAGTALNSMAVIIITATLMQRAGYLKHVVTPEHFHIKGKLLFAFTVFWAYTGFSQYMLIWYANITEETTYFLIRNTGDWNTASIALVFGHFVIPFVILLQAWLKKNSKTLSIMAGYTLVMHALDHYIITIPERSVSLYGMAFAGDKRLADFLNVSTSVPGAFWGDILAFVAIGSGFIFFYLRALTQTATYPHRDPRILESANVSN